MALKLGELVAVLKADDKHFEKGLADAKQKFGGFGDKLKAGALAIGAAIGLTLGAGVVGTLDMGQAQSKLTAQLGSPRFAKDLGAVAGTLYTKGWGESVGQNMAAVRAVMSAGLLPEDATNAAIESITTKAQALADTFDQDVGAAARAAGQMVRTGLAKDAGQAFDIMTRGFQQTGDLAGDLLDTYSEYSTQFRKLGLDGAQATGLLTQGLKAGARDVDIVADAIKEFSIRAIDGSELTKQGFKAIGLDAGKMSKIIAKGGPEAAKALDLTLDRLRAMKDPVARDAAAVALFGTQAEDLGQALYALDPSSATQALGKVTGAADKMADSLGDNAGASLEMFKRKAQQAFIEKLTQAIPHIEGVVSWLGKHKGIVVPLAVAIGVLAGVIGTIIGVYRIWTIAQTALKIVMMLNPIGLVILAVMALIGIVLLIATKTRWFQQLWGAAWGGIKAAISAVWGWIKNNWPLLLAILTGPFGLAVLFVTRNWDKIVSFVKGLPGRISAAARGMWDGIKESFRNAVNWLISRWNNFSLTLGGGSVLGMSIPSVTLHTPNIPYLAQGGIVRATRGGRLAVLGEGREAEAVAPLSRLAAMFRDAVRDVLRERGDRRRPLIENLNVRAYSDRFNLDQVMGDLAMRGVH